MYNGVMARARGDEWVLQVSASILGADASAGWRPRADVFEGATELLVRVELPGVTPKGLTVQFRLARNSLVVRGERRTRLDEVGLTAHQIEIEDGPFSREVMLPLLNLDPANTRSRWVDGVLELRIPIARQVAGRVVVEALTIREYDE